MTYYVIRGDVSVRCAHQHATLMDAYACFANHARSHDAPQECSIVAVTDDGERPLTTDEWFTILTLTLADLKAAARRND